MKKINMKIIGALVLSVMIGLSGQSVHAVNTEAVNLGKASNFTILAKTGISTTGTTKITGDIGVSPAAATFITGFGLSLTADSAFSTSSLVAGKIYAPGYSNPTPANMTTAISDMETAYTDALSRAPGVTELGAGNIGGLTLVPGVYKWGTGLTIPTDVTLSGSANAVWIFQIAQNLDISSNTKIILAGGAQASNIFWVVTGQSTIGTGATFNGNILGKTAIVLNTGAVLNGRALAQTAVTLDSNSVTASTASSLNNDSIAPEISTTKENDTDIKKEETLEVTNAEPVAVSVREEGCSNGNLFNTTNGNVCKNNIVAEAGCSKGNLFNTANGHACNNTIANIVSKYNFGNSTLKLWSKGEEVKDIQKFLNTKLNLGLVVDGILGPKTTEVIKKLQKDNGLVADGLVGIRTKAKMSINN